jgi:pimeloyl-ACP methyl ester carboxylesterase
MGERGMLALAEIRALAARTAQGVITGNYRGAAVSFIDYWSGPGAWAALRPAVQSALTRWMPKAPLDFRALIEEPTRASRYAGLRIPTLILRGEHAPAPTRLIGEALQAAMPAARIEVVAGAGHMGPLTHAKGVNTAIVRHIQRSEAWLDLAIPA